MKKTIAIFVSLDLYYRYDVSATQASRPCRGGRAIGGSREKGVSGGQSGDPKAGVVSINE